MAQKTLDAVIRLMGQTMPSFVRLGTSVEDLGTRIDQIGSKIREFEENGVEIYRGYEDNMLGVRRVYEGRLQSATELEKVMESLDQYASEWAATTIFHTDDVSAALLKATQSGFTYRETIEAIPQAMYIAQAGHLELVDGVDKLATIMRATGSDYGDLATIVDQWAMAADSSKTNIEEMGEAFVALGAASQFADSTQELFTMLAVLADVGTTGSSAGTALRNTMMRIIAPTTKAESAMELLGADAKEISEVLADTNVTKAAKTLKGLGFSVYDTNGNLLPMIDIFTNLYKALDKLEGPAKDEILAAIFPTRTIAAAKAFMESVGNGHMYELFNTIGDSEGYAAKGAETMMSGLTGAIETLASKWEEFQKKIGEVLAPAIETVASWMGQILDFLNSLDEPAMTALVAGLTTLAGLGPGLTAFGAAIAFIGTLGPVGITMTLLSVGASMLVAGFNKLNEISFKGQFGDIYLDLDVLGEHVDSLTTKFDDQNSAIMLFEDNLSQALNEASNAKSVLSENLLTYVLTNAKLTEAEEEQLFGLGDTIGNQVLLGIESAKASDLTFLKALFGNPKTPEEDETGNIAAQVVENWYGGLTAEAYAVGEELRELMTEALVDHELSENERMAIQASIDRYNQIMAQIQSATDAENYYKQEYKANRVSWDTIEDYITENAQKEQEDLEALDEAYRAKYAHYMAAYDAAIKTGATVMLYNGEERPVTDKDKKAFIAELDEAREEARQSIIDKYGGLNYLAFDALMDDSDMVGLWGMAKNIAKIGIGSENWDEGYTEKQYQALLGALKELAGNSNLGKAAKRIYEAGFDIDDDLADVMIDAESLMSTVSEAYNKAIINQSNSGESSPKSVEMTDWMQQYFDYVLSAYEPSSKEYKKAQELRDSIISSIADFVVDIVPALPDAGSGISDSELSADMTDWAQAYMDYMRYFVDIYGSILDRREQEKEFQKSFSSFSSDLTEFAEDAGLAVRVAIDLNTKPVDDYEPPEKEMPIIPVITHRGGGGAPGAGTLFGASGGGIMFLPQELQYAEGGRATTASIFGEAGAEWAIPEAHTERTAQLLNKAREASGFTWGDLISRYGGLNANPSNRRITINYSPTINAQNASGVADVLRADKERLIKMVKDILAEQRFKDEVEVYV